MRTEDIHAYFIRTTVLKTYMHLSMLAHTGHFGGVGVRVIDEASARLREVVFRHNDQAVGVDFAGKAEVCGACVHYLCVHACVPKDEASARKVERACMHAIERWIHPCTLT